MTDRLPDTMLIDEPARRRFEHAWESQRPCLIEDVLPDPSAVHYLNTLEELVHIDIEYRWERCYRRLDAGQPETGPIDPTGELQPPAISSYLERFPELRSPEIEQRLMEQHARCQIHADRRGTEDRSAAPPQPTPVALTPQPEPPAHGTIHAGWLMPRVPNDGSSTLSSFDDDLGPAAPDSSLHVLRRIPLFQMLSDHILVQISRYAQEARFETGDEILREGIPSPGLFVIVEGEARVTCSGTDSGTPVMLNDVGYGDVLGEMSLMTGQVCAATVRATTTLRALQLSAEDCERLTHEAEGFSVACLQLLSSRLGQDLTDAFCGKTIGEYQVLSVLGRGASGIVYRARHELSGQIVAVKMLKPALTCDTSAIARFEREADVMRRIDHPNIVRLLDDFRAFNTLFLVTEFCEGGSLADVVKRSGPVPTAVLKRILGQIAGALQAAHSCGITHRDLKPANVFIADDGRARLGDFSIAYLEGTARLTGSHHLVGTPRYMAPEQLVCEEVTPATDLFALGCVAYEMATGRVLFDGETIREIVSQHFSQEKRPRSFDDVADASLREFLELALQPEAGDRQVDLTAVIGWADESAED